MTNHTDYTERAYLSALKERLTVLLLELKDGKHEAIEFGEQDAPGGYFSHLRIRWMKTAGGYQFGLKQLSASGVEGSGFYSPFVTEISDLATRMIERYLAPSPLPFKRTPDWVTLTWFPFKEGRQRLLSNHPCEDLLGGDVTTVQLEKP